MWPQKRAVNLKKLCHIHSFVSCELVPGFHHVSMVPLNTTLNNSIDVHIGMVEAHFMFIAQLQFYTELLSIQMLPQMKFKALLDFTISKQSQSVTHFLQSKRLWGFHTEVCPSPLIEWTQARMKSSAVTYRRFWGVSTQQLINWTKRLFNSCKWASRQEERECLTSDRSIYECLK